MLFSRVSLLKPVISSLYRLMNRKHKVYLVILIMLTVGSSLIETIGVSVIMPFISLASDPRLVNTGYYKKAFDFFHFANVESFIISLGISIIIFYVIRAIYSVLLVYSQNRFSFGMYKYLSMKIFNVSLAASYKVHALKNTGELMQAITNEASDASRVLLNVLQFFSEIFTIGMVYAVIVLLNWKLTLILTAVLLLIVLILLSFLAAINRNQGQKRLISGRNLNRTLKETFSNFKFVKLKGNEEDILKLYDGIIEMRTRSEVINNLLSIMPKNILESLGFSLLVAVVVYIVWVYHDASQVIPIITMYALALYRILPSTHRMLSNLNYIAYMQKTLESVDESLNQPVENEGAEPIVFNQAIRLDTISFKYISGGEVLANVSLDIKKGEKIAITGESGSGKTTLVDIIIGIHRPVTGTVFIDNIALTESNIRSWRKKIGYIPQTIYLFDGTVADNVSFGSKPDENRIITALHMANIWEFLCEKDGLKTKVGEGGIQLSGGQQQRIGIARALYDDPEVLVLDEATSALDSETERKIMEELYDVSKNKTLIIIAHRLSTVEQCDRKITMEHGKIIK